MSLCPRKWLAPWAIVGGLALGSPGAAEDAPFARWLDDLRREAAENGISDATLDATLSDLSPIERVLELDRHQPEFTQTLWTYLDKRVTPRVIETGRRMMRRHATLLEQVAARHGVQKRFLVAFWGLESHYGAHTGGFPLVGALATLAHDRRRADFFRAQVLSALDGIEAGDIPLDARSSWAGAMGHCQFIPTTFAAYAVDGDGDGRRDMWGSLPDVFGSAANYLARSGWDPTRTWGREVRLPSNFDLDLIGLKVRKSLKEWQMLGVRKVDGRDLPKVAMDGSLILPAGVRGPAFLVYDNFRTIMVWNRSQLYAVAVGHLADRLIGKEPLRTPRPADTRSLSRRDIEALQARLTSLGYDPGPTDGIAGPGTRDAIRRFQKHARLPADGYPTFGLLERLGIASRPAPARPLADDGRDG